MPFVTVNDIDVHYQITGEGDPLLLIHGLGSSGRDWEMQVGYFARNYQVITYDLRGHGRSTKAPGPYSIKLFADDTALLLQGINPNPAHVLGISLGGMVAFQLAVNYPYLMRSLIAVNSTPELIPTTVKDYLWIWQRLLIIQLFGLRKIGKLLANRFFPSPDQDQLRKIFIERWGENHKESYLLAMKAIFGWSVLDQIEDIKIPTLVIGGDDDYFPTEDKKTYTKRIPGAELVIVSGTKHALPVEKPLIFNQIVEQFICSVSG